MKPLTDIELLRFGNKAALVLQLSNTDTEAKLQEIQEFMFFLQNNLVNATGRCSLMVFHHS